MEKICSIGLNIFGASEIPFLKQKSLDDYDVVFFNPLVIHTFAQNADTMDFQNGDRTPDEDSSKQIDQYFEHWTKEFMLALNAGKAIIVAACPNYVIKYAKRANSGGWHILEKNIYSVLGLEKLSTKIIEGEEVITRKSGIQVLLESVVPNMNYCVSFENIENVQNSEVVLETKGKRPVGLFIKSDGNRGKILIVPKPLDLELFYEEEKYQKISKLLTQMGRQLYRLQECIKEIPPEWVFRYKTKEEQILTNQLKDLENKKCAIDNEISATNDKINNESVYKYLLFGNGKNLEDAVILALQTMGIKASRYRFAKKDLEIDVLAEVDGNILMGECEGKDSKDVDKTKLSQLLTNKVEYYDEPKVDPNKPIKEVLFGNPMRLKAPSSRTLDFTKACKAIAVHNQVALVKTVDLYKVATYVHDNKDKKFAKLCIEAIMNTSCGIVSFPKIPTSEKIS